MSHHIGLQVLKAKIRGFQAAGSTISSRISRAHKERKHRLWDAKRKLGTHCRYHLVAYGLLRGVPYDRIERCTSANQLQPERVLEIIKSHGSWDQRFDLASVKALLTVQPVVVAPVPAREPSLKRTEARRLGLLEKARRLLEKTARV